jgi:hypothetical protein
LGSLNLVIDVCGREDDWISVERKGKIVSMSW